MGRLDVVIAVLKHASPGLRLDVRSSFEDSSGYKLILAL